MALKRSDHTEPGYVYNGTSTPVEAVDDADAVRGGASRDRLAKRTNTAAIINIRREECSSTFIASQDFF
ncbi:MAG TPA: hypothetical protein VJN71_08170 [Nitrososphaerales archaeon]|nr:hypothetical protein [Nitrososphaerales archaeon]